MNIVIYARFSSHSQNEQSIEGQLKACYEFARKNSHTVIENYIDRAFSGTNDNRPEFQRMINDSNSKHFEGVLVYQLDRFARNRYDSAIYKALLKKNGIRVLSARENITDDASGILVEGLLESMAEYYSAELSQKIKRGMDINAQKCLVTGGYAPLGLKVVDKKYVIDEMTSPIVKEIFTQYANGSTVKEVIDNLNSRGIKTTTGSQFNKNSIRKMLQNKRYIGTYSYRGFETKDAIPRIIEDDLFYKVAEIVSKNKIAPARSRAISEYLLTTKVFCGLCKELMVGNSGTSKTGRSYSYYKCKNARKGVCTKKIINKDYLEDLVISECRKLLNAKNISLIAKEVIKLHKQNQEKTSLISLERNLRENKKSIDNLLKALESGEVAEIITNRIHEKNLEKIEIEKQIALEKKGKLTLTEQEIKFFLNQLKVGNIDDLKYRKTLINVFVLAVYVYDDRVTIFFNTGNNTTKLNPEDISYIDAHYLSGQSSSIELSAPPKSR